MYKASKAEEDIEGEVVTEGEMPDYTTEDTPEDSGLNNEREIPAEQDDDINKALNLDSDSAFEHDDDDDDDDDDEGDDD